MKPQKIIVVDDHPYVAHSISGQLSGDLFAVRPVVSADGLRRCLAEAGEPPKLVILDIELPDADGVELISEIRLRYQLPVLVFSASSDLETIRACEQNGASGFVGKSTDTDAIKLGIDAVLAGAQFFPPIYIKSGRNATLGNNVLTSRQRQVLDRIMLGDTYAEIANKIGVTDGYIANIASLLLQQFNVRSRQKLAVAAAKLGYKPRH